MVIHSVTPPYLLMEQPEQPQMTVRPAQGGYMEGVETPRGFQMTRLWSTDPAMYLRSDLSPGSVVRQEQQ